MDYYDISINDVLATVTLRETIRRCALGQQLYCDNLVQLRGTNATFCLIGTRLLEQLVGGQRNVSRYDTLGRYCTAGVRIQF